MTCIGFLSVAPVVEESMAPYVADAVAALDDFDVEYETTPMGTIVEAEDSAELFAAAHAAHEAVGGQADRVETFLKIDDKRTVDQRADEKVAAVEASLGRAARSDAEEAED
ncbi:MTH1187 family thiamine-binding protein [Haloarcula litorea]|uniref:MTH1187 family thiamine-binding protein n=1 Tax=Haloarcula litorea TaxID=3032579 RepID=UPI0023E7C7CC|nr:MTH1187 family thiamine-binding protein [Halomicroarcula sp. GDY20]